MAEVMRCLPFGFSKRATFQKSRGCSLRSAAGENDFARLRAQKFRRAITRIVEQSARFSADVMDGRRIAPKLAEETAALLRAPPGRAALWRCNRNKSCAALVLI
jgi:hypothetical protein